MKHIYTILIIMLLSLFTFLFVYRSINNDTSFTSDKKLSIVCTTGMITDVVKNIGKNLVDVHGLMGPGVDPHLYRARAGDMQKLTNADIIFYNGLHLEGKMAEVFESLQSYKIVRAVSDAITVENLRSTGYENIYDPHIWHDVVLLVQVSTYISSILQEHDHENNAVYACNEDEYVEQLRTLHKKTTVLLNDIPKEKRILVTAHDAFGYFGARYGLEVIGLQGISTDADVGVKDIRRVVDVIATRDVPAIFVESSIPQRTVRAVQDAVAAQGKHVAIGGELYSDALGDGDASTYIGMIQHNVRALHSALKV